MSRQRVPVLACLVLVLAASMTHVAAGFGSLEADTTAGAVVGWLAALGIDSVGAVLMWRLMGGNASGRGWALVGIAIMAVVSAYANLAHAVGVAAAGETAAAVLKDWHAAPAWQVARVVILSVTLPALTLALAAVAHSDTIAHGDARAADAPADAVVPAEHAPAHDAVPAPVPAVPPARPVVPDVLSIALAEPWRTNVDIARRVGIDASRVSRRLKAAGIVRGTDGMLRAGMIEADALTPAGGGRNGQGPS